MRSPQSLRNGGGGGGGGGGTPSPHARIPTPHHHFHSTVSVQKLKRFNSLILVFRLSTFCFSLASAVFMITNSRGSGSDSPRWYDFDAFRYVFAANAIVAVYSLFEMIASVWEISREVTLFPEILQVWFDFGHDQAFAYLLLSADSAGTALAITLKGTDTCKGVLLCYFQRRRHVVSGLIFNILVILLCIVNRLIVLVALLCRNFFSPG